jgi:hypothetical protein
MNKDYNNRKYPEVGEKFFNSNQVQFKNVLDKSFWRLNKSMDKNKSPGAEILDIVDGCHIPTSIQ